MKIIRDKSHKSSPNWPIQSNPHVFGLGWWFASPIKLVWVERVLQKIKTNPYAHPNFVKRLQTYMYIYLQIKIPIEFWCRRDSIPINFKCRQDSNSSPLIDNKRFYQSKTTKLLEEERLKNRKRLIYQSIDTIMKIDTEKGKASNLV